jgi:hypothetical protein
MNTLSWFLYFADVFSGLDRFFAIAAILSLCGLVASIVFYSCQTKSFEEASNYCKSRGIPCEVVSPKRYKPVVFWSLGIFLVSATCATVLPSKNTMYAIAASEMGEKALASEVGKKAQQAIEVWITQQIGEKK